MINRPFIFTGDSTPQKQEKNKLIMKDSIEEKILKLQEAKKDLADEILKGENGNLGSLSQEELRELIG